MKNSIKTYVQLFLCIACLGFFSCEGPPGPQGPAGRDGTNGKDGNANVQSKTFIVAGSDWRAIGSIGSPGAHRRAILPYSAISQSIVNTGIVLVYIKSGSSWNFLPYTGYESGYSYTVNYSYKIGQVYLRRYDSDHYPLNYPGTYRVVVIESSTNKNMPDIDYSDYEMVAAYFGLGE